MIIGSDFIDQTTASSADDCCTKCDANSACVAYTFATDSHDCFLKNNLGGNQTHPDRISGTNGRKPFDTWDACSPPHDTYPFCDTSLSQADRLKDLVSRVSLDDIGAQLTARESSALPDIGVPSYYWGTNAIHGVQNVGCLNDVGLCPTSFPAPCTLVSAFNTSLIFDMGQIIGRELRAYYNHHAHNSLDTWSPTGNMNRDPRWGRNVESPGEDPFLNGEFMSSYAEGLQGKESVVMATVTLKHWIAYSVEDYDGVTRHTYNAEVSEYDLTETYFPAYEATVKNGALGIMCSYNELNGKPTCGNPALTSILRDQWGFKGYITSDSDAVGDIANSHHYAPNTTVATAEGLLAGCDIDSGNTYKDNVAKAVNESFVDISYPQASLGRIFQRRFDMGLFDPKVPNPYRSIPVDIVGSAPHQASSALAARKGMVLLKNDKNTLPFAKGKKVAVLGICTNKTEPLLGNYDGPICLNGGFDCYPSIYTALKAANAGGDVSLVDDVTKVTDAVAAAKAADQVVVVGCNFYNGGREGLDRHNISLDPSQQTFVDAVLAVDRPTALVLINGGIIALDDMATTAPAILEAFSPGVHGAEAIVDTLFGDNVPGGKMPVTLYKSSYIDAVDFLNMSMQAGPGRSYRYLTDDSYVTYPFGYGLSYTTFKLSWSPAPPAPVVFTSVDGQATTYSVNVTNTGKVTGDEVVMAFYKPDASSLSTIDTATTPVINKQLFAFERVTVAPGETKTLSFTTPASRLSLTDSDGHRSVHSGSYSIQFSRGHGEVLEADIQVDLEEPHRLFTFPQKWW